MKWFSNLLWGLVFIAIGIIWGINSLGIADINIFFSGWWTLFIIIPSIVGLFKDSNKTGSIIGLSIGVVLLLVAQDLIGFETLWKLALPIVFVTIGVSFIFGDVFQSQVSEKVKKLNKDGLEEYAAIFAGQKVNLSAEEFRGASISAVFGGVEFNMKESTINQEQIINATAVFGGIEIMTPAGVNVKVKSTPIFGGVSNKAPQIKGENIPTLYVNALCLFGGVEIK